MRASTRTFVVGALLLPLSIVPFGLYATQTPEGRLLTDRAIALVAPPELPDHSRADLHEIEQAAPHFDDGVAVLVYHGIGSGSSAEGDFNLSPQQFADHIGALRAAGMEPVTMGEVAAARTGGPELPDNAVAVTFDDGRNDAMMFADPLLEAADWKATMYVISSQAGDGTSPYYAGWDDLVGYQASGRWDLQAHSHELHHEAETEQGLFPALTALRSDETLTEFRARIRADLETNLDVIEAHTGVRPTTFAYPFGAYGAERSNDPRLQQIVAEEVGRLFDMAVDQDGQDEMVLADACSEPLNVHRLDVHDWTGLELLEEIADAAERSRAATPGCGSGG